MLGFMPVNSARVILDSIKMMRMIRKGHAKHIRQTRSFRVEQFKRFTAS